MPQCLTVRPMLYAGAGAHAQYNAQCRMHNKICGKDK